MHKDGQKLWQDILTGVKLQVSLSTFKTWFSGSYVIDFKKTEDKNILIVGFKNSFLKEQVEGRYSPVIDEVKNKKGYMNLEVIFVVSQRESVNSIGSGPLFTGEPQRLSPTFRKFEALNPNYIFDNFVVGAANNLAHVAANQVAKNLGQAYNPLLIYGPTGVGKTHLLHAIGNEAIDKTIDIKVLYTTSEKFTNEYIQSLNNRTQQLFRQKYRNVDVLLIDDVQFFAGKESTQDEFFHCFNELTLSGRQVVAASDRHPKELGQLKERLMSRFLGGMVADISYPDIEMKMAIILAKCREKNINLDTNIVEFIARESGGGARELEGVLTSTMAKIRLSGGKFEPVELKKLVAGANLKKISTPSPKNVLSVVCRFFNVGEEQIRGSSRKASIVRARQVLMYLLRLEVGLSLSGVGEIVGGRDHSTVIHSVEKIRKSIATDSVFRDEVLRIKEVINK